MLFESRTYTFRPGTLSQFWEAQLRRGIDPVSRPIMARVIGYFSTISGDQDQVTHLWRFDNFDDWRDRLFFKHPNAEPYYKVVRPLMLSQENSFLMPSPLDELNPLWRNGADWLPGSPPIGDIVANPNIIIEEMKFQLLPGTLNVFWQAFRNNSLMHTFLTEFLVVFIPWLDNNMKSFYIVGIKPMRLLINTIKNYFKLVCGLHFFRKRVHQY